jgi:anti-sigma-K factor RskA
VSGDHETFDELAVGWALHSLEPEDEAVFTAHLAGCDRCARTVAETEEVMAALATDLPPAEPSSELRSRLREAVERTEQLPVHRPAPRPAAPTGFPDYDDAGGPATHPLAARWRRSLPSLLAAAAFALILALGVWNVVLSESRSQAEATEAAQARIIAAMLTPGRATIAPVSAPSGDAVATVMARPDQVAVITHGLKVNDAADTTYVLWGMQAGQPVALGTFDVAHTQMDLRTVGSTRTGLDQFAAYAISLEKGHRAPPKPTDVVATGQVTK